MAKIEARVNLRLPFVVPPSSCFSSMCTFIRSRAKYLLFSGFLFSRSLSFAEFRPGLNSRWVMSLCRNRLVPVWSLSKKERRTSRPPFRTDLIIQPDHETSGGGTEITEDAQAFLRRWQREVEGDNAGSASSYSYTGRQRRLSGGNCAVSAVAASLSRRATSLRAHVKA